MKNMPGRKEISPGTRSPVSCITLIWRFMHMPQGFGNSQTTSQGPKPFCVFRTKHPASIIKNPSSDSKTFFPPKPIQIMLHA